MATVIRGSVRIQGEAKTRSVWAQGITSAMVDAATWMTEEERAELNRTISSYTVPHAMYRLSLSRAIMAVDSPWIHMSYTETQFLLAETTIRGWGIDTETAESRFAKGYEAAVKQFSLFGVSAADMLSDEEIQDYMTTYLPLGKLAGRYVSPGPFVERSLRKIAFIVLFSWYMFTLLITGVIGNNREFFSRIC